MCAYRDSSLLPITTGFAPECRIYAVDIDCILGSIDVSLSTMQLKLSETDVLFLTVCVFECVEYIIYKFKTPH